MHYLSPEEGGIYLALRAAGRQWELPSWVEHYGLAPSDWPDFRSAVRAALRDGPLTVAELGGALTGQRAYRHLQPVFDEGAGTLVKPLTWQGDMSFGPLRDGLPTFQRLDDNPRWRGIPRPRRGRSTRRHRLLPHLRPGDSGPPPLLARQRAERGPQAAREVVLRARRRLTAVDVDGTTAYVVRDDVDSLEATRPSEAVRLLPGHDQWVIGPGTKDVTRHPVVPARPRDPQGQPGDVRRGGVRDVDTQG